MAAVDICDPETTAGIYEELLNRGFILGNRGSTFRIDPPLTISRIELEQFLNTFQAVLLGRQG
jgi:acetylornithine aminotransferase